MHSHARRTIFSHHPDHRTRCTDGGINRLQAAVHRSVREVCVEPRAAATPAERCCEEMSAVDLPCRRSCLIRTASMGSSTETRSGVENAGAEAIFSSAQAERPCGGGRQAWYRKSCLKFAVLIFLRDTADEAWH